MMPAIVKAKAEPGLWLEQVPVPNVGPDDVLIRTKKASICGTDIHIYNWDAWAQKTIPVPMTIGHEFVGEIASVGTNVRGFMEGDLVVGEGHITCGHCRNCLAGRRHLCPNTEGVGVNRPGAWAEFVTVPARPRFAGIGAKHGQPISGSTVRVNVRRAGERPAAWPRLLLFRGMRPRSGRSSRWRRRPRRPALGSFP